MRAGEGVEWATQRRGERARGREGGTGRGGEETATDPLLTPADKVVIAYLAIIALVILFLSNRIEHWGWLCAGHVAVCLLIVLLARWDASSGRLLSPSPPLPLSPSPRPPLASFVHGWYPVALIGLTYKELTYLIPRIQPRDFDSKLAAIDYHILGVNPTVWLERFTWPFLTEVLQVTYSTYYLLPVILGAVLWRKRWLDKYFFWVFVVMLGFYLSYLGYIAVPAIGPRFLPSIVEAQTRPLTGMWLFVHVRQLLDSAEGITRDCFPSGHTELTLLVLYYARKFHRRSFWWFLPFGIGIIVSTVYLRYHYVIDVVAGALLAVLVVVVSESVYRLLRGDARALK